MSEQTPSTRGRASRVKGRKYEQDVAHWLRGRGFAHAERAVRNGWQTKEHLSADPFDLVGTPGLLWSLKNHEQASEDQHQRWLREVHDVATERGLIGVLVAKRVGRSDIGASYAYRMLPQPYVTVKQLPIRTDLSSMVDLLRAEGYGDPASDLAVS